MPEALSKGAVCTNSAALEMFSNETKVLCRLYQILASESFDETVMIQDCRICINESFDPQFDFVEQLTSVSVGYRQVFRAQGLITVKKGDPMRRVGKILELFGHCDSQARTFLPRTW